MIRYVSLLFLLSGLVGLGAEPWIPEVHIEGARQWGGDLQLRWGSFSLLSGAGYESWKFGRDRSTGDPRSGSPESLPTLNANLMARWTWTWSPLEFWVGPGIWGWGNGGWGAQSSGFSNDLDGNLIGFGQGGVTWDLRRYGPHHLESGSFVQASFETGPSFAAVRHTDYSKVVVHSSYFIPLIDLPGPRQRFSALVGFRWWGRWIDGQHVPFALQEGTDVRGYTRLLDSQFSSVATSELRVFLGSLGDRDLVPLFFTFVDTGWYAGFAGAPTQGDAHGFLLSTGAGIGLSFFELATPTLTFAVPWTDGESTIWWKLNFNLRF